MYFFFDSSVGGGVWELGIGFFFIIFRFFLSYSKNMINCNFYHILYDKLHMIKINIFFVNMINCNMIKIFKNNLKYDKVRYDKNFGIVQIYFAKLRYGIEK